MVHALTPNAAFPKFKIETLTHGTVEVGTPDKVKGDWQLVIVYRGKHCPICKNYLTELNGMFGDFNEIGVDVIALSADPKEKAEVTAGDIGYDGVIGYDLSLDQMAQLGVYISDPRSPEETDRPFSEPAAFVVRDSGELHIVDISNAPFARPALEGLLNGLKFIRGNDYPVRGTHTG
ncbi:MAG: redoxin domain-containing protein [Octadecabacter sp.]